MKDTSKKALLQLGMDLPKTLSRFVGNEGMLLKFLRRFMDDKTFDQLTEAMQAGDMQEAFHHAHTLKGVVGNLGLDTLFEATSPLVETLRSGDVDQSNALYPPVKEAYEQVLSVISTLDEP